jgi:glucose/arabinose dehydrogenase
MALLSSTVLAACSPSEDASGAGGSLFDPAPKAGGKSDHLDNCDAEIKLTPTFAGLVFTQPTVARQHPSLDVFYVVEKRGVIWRVPANTSSAADVTLFADLRGRVNAIPQEAGMLGIALHPDFDQNGEVFISYTAPSAASPANLQSRVSRFVSTNGGTSLDATSEQVLLAVSQPFENHNGGDIEFGPDGLLYIGLGDGGSAGDPQGNGQNVNTLLGKMLRIDVDSGTPYGIPADNPFAGGGGRPEIFAWGLRNPWRFSFDSVGGTLIAGDVGQDAFEEIDIIELGGNYGWRTREGAHCFNPSVGCNTAGLVEPLAEYGHDEGISVTGGYLYRGSAIASLTGQYVFTDFATGRFWALASAPGGGIARRLVAEAGHNIASFAEDASGELLAVDHFGGQVYRLESNEDCSGDPVMPGDDGGDGGATDPGSFASVYDNILQPRCSPCHTGGASGGLSLASEAAAFGNLVNADASTPACSGRSLVVPGDAANSVLFQKVSGIDLCGSMMPPGSPLSAAELAAVETWIEQGAEP